MARRWQSRDVNQVGLMPKSTCVPLSLRRASASSMGYSVQVTGMYTCGVFSPCGVEPISGALLENDFSLCFFASPPQLRDEVISFIRYCKGADTSFNSTGYWHFGQEKQGGYLRRWFEVRGGRKTNSPMITVPHRRPLFWTTSRV